MRLATFSLFAALLACGAAAYQDPAYPTPFNTSKNVMGVRAIVGGMMTGMAALPGKLGRGEFVVNNPGTATEKVEVDPGCLNTVVPPPLNWGPLWCGGPGREAKVQQWYDEVGSLHRSFDIPVQANVTSNMVFWLFSPMYPQYLDFNGKLWFWYHLWHPMDHVMAANKVSPSTATLGKPGIYTLIHERYRNLPGEEAKQVFETDLWFHVEDLFSNFLKKRVVITVNMAGMQAWTLIVNLKDTPAGLKIDNELIIGAAAQGYDPTDPAKGAAKDAAQVINDNLVKPMLSEWASGEEYARALNAISRHVVEEFSMYRFFLPQVWARYPHLRGMFDMADSAGQLVQIPRLNYGFNMKDKPAPGPSGMAELLAPLNRTALHNVTQLVGAVKSTPQALLNSATVGLNSQIQGAAATYNSVVRAWNTGNVTKIRDAVKHAKIPSSVGADA